MYLCMCVYVRMCVHVCVYVHTYVCVCVMYVYTYVRVCVHMCMHTCTYVCKVCNACIHHIMVLYICTYASYHGAVHAYTYASYRGAVHMYIRIISWCCTYVHTHHIVVLYICTYASYHGTVHAYMHTYVAWLTVTGETRHISPSGRVESTEGPSPGQDGRV